MTDTHAATCPYCQTQFHISEGQLKIAAGKVRCGNCLEIFDALAQAPDTATEASLTPAPTSEPTPKPAAAALQALELQDSKSLTDQTTSSALTLELPMDESDFRKPRGAQLNWLQRTAYLITLLCLLAALVLQTLWFNREHWVQKDTLRPLYPYLYQITNQPMPPRQNFSQIKNHKLVLQPHKKYYNGIRASLLLENQADFTQPFPRLHLTFHDLTGILVAQRILTPADYIDAQRFPSFQMPSQQPVELHIDFINPGPAATSYQLTLLPH